MADKDFKVKKGLHVPESVGIGNESPVVSLDMTGKTDAIAVPTGTTDQRPTIVRDGMIRYNVDRNEFEAYSTPKGGWALMTTEGSSVDAYTFGGYRPEYFLNLVNSTNILPTARLVGRYDNVTGLNAVEFFGQTSFYAASRFGANTHGKVEIGGLSGTDVTGMIQGRDASGRAMYQIYGSGQSGGYRVEMVATTASLGGWQFRGDVNIIGKLTATSYENLGLGTMSTQNANNVNITGGTATLASLTATNGTFSTSLNVTGVATLTRGTLTTVEAGAQSMVNRGFVENLAANAAYLTTGQIGADRVPHLHYETTGDGEVWLSNTSTGIGNTGAIGLSLNGALTYRYGGTNRMSFDSTGTMTMGTIPIARVSGLEAALSTYAPLNSPALTGTPTAPNATIATNTQQLATTAFVHSYGATKVSLSGDAMTGFLTLHADPTSALHAATRRYVDAQDNLRMPYTGGTFTGFITLYGDPTAALHPTSKQYVDNGFIASAVNTAAEGQLVVFNGNTGRRVGNSGRSIAQLLDRTNHTGSQPISSISGLQAALDQKQNQLTYNPVNKSGDNVGTSFFSASHGAQIWISGTYNISTSNGNFQWMGVSNHVTIVPPTDAHSYSMAFVISKDASWWAAFGGGTRSFGDVNTDNSFSGAGSFFVTLTAIGGTKVAYVQRL